MPETRNSESVSTRLERIAQLAKRRPGVPLRTLAHHIDINWLHEAYRRTRKDSAAGVDGQMAAEYQANLGENLESLLDKAKSGDHYRAPPVRRVHIPKGDGKNKTRPIGIATVLDRFIEQAILQVIGCPSRKPGTGQYRRIVGGATALEALSQHGVGIDSELGQPSSD
jgi:RNA-directed DNA polymerase